MAVSNFILIVFILSIIFNAIGDGIRMRDIKEQSKRLGLLYHMFWALEKLTLLSLIIVPMFLKFNDVMTFTKFILYLLGYSLMRFGIFDPIHNIAAKKHPQYIGETSTFDRFFAKRFNTGTKKTILSGIKFTLFIVGMALIQSI